MKNTARLNSSNRLRPTVWAVALLLSGAVPAVLAADVCTTASTTISTAQVGADNCQIETNGDSLTVTSTGNITSTFVNSFGVVVSATGVTITNAGTLKSTAGFRSGVGVANSGQVSVLNNQTGAVIEGSGGSSNGISNEGTITTLTNAGAINAVRGVTNYATITSLINSGSITASSRGIDNSGTIGTLTNTGTITGAGFVGIDNLNGTITILNNSQAGLKYYGTAPTTYNTYITNTTTFGTLEVINTASWNVNYGIATGSTLAVNTYQDVIFKSGTTTYLNTTDKTGTFTSGGTLYYWTLHHDGAAWDLVVTLTAPASANTYTSATTALRNTPAAGAAGVLDANTNLSALFTGVSTTQQYSDAASQTLPLLTGGSAAAANAMLFGMNQVVQGRMAATSGLSSGDALTDKNFWIKPFGSDAKQSDLGGVSGFKATTGGLALGVDGSVSPQWRVGGAFATARSKVDGNASTAPQSLTVDAYQFIGYGTYSVDARTAVSVQVDVGHNNNSATRDIPLASRVAQASYTSQTVHAGVRGSRAYPLNAQTVVVPSLRADYTWIKDNSYTETGAGLLNLAVDSRSTDALVLGADVAVDHQLSKRTSLVASAGVGYDTINKRSSVTAAFAGAPGAAFTTNGMQQNPWMAQLGAGVVYKDGQGLEVTGRYDAEQREQFLNQTLSAKLQWAF